jgi:hypothetical protein
MTFKEVNMHDSIVTFEEGKYYCTLHTRYGFTCFEGQDPYFSITSMLTGDNGYRACGCLHNDIRKHDSSLSPLIKWHLTSLVTGPMHYIANGMFWWERSLMSEPKHADDLTAIGDKALENFKSTVVYGATFLDDIDFDNRKSIDPEKIRAWMNLRFNELMQAFYHDLREFKLIGE